MSEKQKSDESEYSSQGTPSNTGTFPRRNVLKGVGAGLVAATGLTGVPSVAARDERSLQPGEEDLPHKNVERVVVSDEIKAVTNNWELLTTDLELLLKRISASNLRAAERDEAQTVVERLQREYPTERTRDGNAVRVRLKESPATSSVRPQEIRKAAAVVGDGATALHGDELHPEWSKPTHRNLGEISADKMGLPSSGIDTIEQHADDPDDWEANIPGWVPGQIADFIDQVVHSYGHYRNPDLGIGGAPSNAEDYLEDAVSSESSGDTEQAYTETAWASHFIVDVGQPLHTGAEYSQYQNQWVHFDYESFVHDNWNSGEEFVTVVEDTTTHYEIDDPAQATTDLAIYANDYCDTLFDTINNNPDTWQDDDSVIEITENCLVKASQYNKGFVRYVFW